MKLKVDFRTEQGLKRSNELELFRRLEKLSSKPAKQINYDGVIDFLLHSFFSIGIYFIRISRLKFARF